MIELHQQSASATSGTSLEEFETRCGQAAVDQRAVNWWIGDLALAVERQHPSTFHQAWPVWMSPEHIERCKAVAAAYSPETRNIHATWSVHMQNSKQPDRVALVQAHVDAGHTSDEARKTPVTPEPEPAAPVVATKAKTPWLLAVDLNYYIQRSFPKDGVETAANVCGWLQRLIARLQEKGLTDVVVCFDSPTNHRRALTDGWEQPYKERTKKDPELVAQLVMVRELLEKLNIPCVVIAGMESDDVMASYAKQFQGKTTLLTPDKDLRQCLSATCNILRDLDWETHAETGTLMPVYKWVVGKFPEDKEKPDNVSCHMTDGLNYAGAAVKGISPEVWPQFQAIAGDSTDDIDGCKGIGGLIGMKLIHAHGTLQGVLDAFADGSIAVKLNKTQVAGMEAFATVADVMLQLTTLRSDLPVPQITRLSLKE